MKKLFLYVLLIIAFVCPAFAIIRSPNIDEQIEQQIYANGLGYEQVAIESGVLNAHLTWQGYQEQQAMKYREKYYQLGPSLFTAVNNLYRNAGSSKRIKQVKIYYNGKLIEAYPEAVTKVIQHKKITSEITFKMEYGRSDQEMYVYTFYKQGKQIAKRTYDNYDTLRKAVGKIPDGVALSYDNEGGIEKEVSFKGNKRNGIVKEYDNGDIRCEGTYKDDKRNGEYKIYRKGKLTDVLTYKNGKLNCP